MQVIDDTAGSTLAAASTLTADVRSQLSGLGANQVGRLDCTFCSRASRGLLPRSRSAVPATTRLTCCSCDLRCSRSHTSAVRKPSRARLSSYNLQGPITGNLLIVWHLLLPLLQEAAQLVGRKIAELCLSKDIEKVAFDRGGHVYHGRIKASRLQMPSMYLLSEALPCVLVVASVCPAGSVAPFCHNGL